MFVNHPLVLRLLHDPSVTVEFCPVQPRHKHIQNETIKMEEDPLDTRKYETRIFKKNIRKQFNTNIKTKLRTIPAKSSKTKMVLKKDRRKKARVANKLVENTRENKEEIEEIKDVIKEENTKIIKEVENVESECVNTKDKSTKDESTSGTEAVHCDICDKTFTDNLSYGLHSKEHSENGKYSCHICKLMTCSKYRFTLHIRLHEGTTPYKCPTCKKPFANASEAAEHVNFHTGEKPFICEVCGKTFMFSRFLSTHRRYHHWEIVTGKPFNKYDCTKCNIHYTSPSALKRHNLIKHSGGVIQSSLCDICGKELSSKEKLKFHKRTHTGYKPHTCSFCPKAFVRKELLKEHERVHTGEKPYSCRFCQKSFSQRTPMKVHERLHTGEKPYVCTLCARGFTSKGAMDNHMKICNGKPK